MNAVKVNLGKVSITVNGIWEDKDYDKLSLVYHTEKNASYISVRPVPKGTIISDRKYWTMIVQGAVPGEIYTKTEIDYVLAASIETIKKYIDTNLENYYNKEEIDSKLIAYATKEDLERDYAKKSEIPTIPNFKTVNGQSIIGEGDIVIESSDNESNYTPTLAESTKITTTIGSIKAGSTLGELAGKSYSEIIDSMLINETYTDPNYTHTISLGDINSLVKVGSSVVIPSVTAIWNDNIQSDSPKTIKTNLAKYILGTSNTVYNTSGNSTFALIYSYPEGYYDITSNLGNTKRIIVPSKKNYNISKTVTATYPWFINNTEQSLVAIGSSKTIEIELTGSPSIKVPFANSTVTIQADLGFGWMDVNWNVSEDNSNLGGAIDETVPYKVYSKPDSYASSVKHKITINLRK